MRKSSSNSKQNQKGKREPSRVISNGSLNKKGSGTNLEILKQKSRAVILALVHQKCRSDDPNNLKIYDANNSIKVYLLFRPKNIF